MTCKECLYYEVCKDYLINCAEHGEAERINNPCTKFKNKADYVEVKDCNLCVFNSRHATEYPCSHCKNCYTDKFKPIE